MYQVIFDDGYWWIMKDNEVLTELGGFIEPVTPNIIVKEIENEL